VKVGFNNGKPLEVSTEWGTVYISDASVTVCVNLGNKIEEIETSEISPGRWFRLRRKPAKHSERDMGEGVLPQAKLQLRY